MARLPHPCRSTFHGGGNRIHGFFLLHPGLCSVRGLLREGGQNRGRTGGITPGPSLSLLLTLGRGGLGWPQEREVFELRLWAVSHIGLRTQWWAGPGPRPRDTRRHCGLTAQAHKHLCQGETRTRSLDPGPLPWAQGWETLNVGGRREKTGPGSSPNFRPPLHQLRVWVQGGLGMFLPEAGKGEARQRSRRPLGWGRRGTQQHGAGPSSHLARTRSPSLPQGLGP